MPTSGSAKQETNPSSTTPPVEPMEVAVTVAEPQGAAKKGGVTFDQEESGRRILSDVGSGDVELATFNAAVGPGTLVVGICLCIYISIYADICICKGHYMFAFAGGWRHVGA